MKIKAQIVLASHLSDLQIETTINSNSEIEERIKLRLGFLKYLNFILNGDFTKEINPDVIYSDYLKDRKKNNQ